MKKLFLCFLASGLLFNMTFAQGKKTQDKKTAEPAKFELKNGVDSFSYAAGVNIGQNMKDQGITELNIEAMSKALEEIIQGKPTLLNKEQANMTLQQKLQDFAKKKGDAEKAKCQNYFDENKKRPGVISLPNGLQYEIMKAGEANGMKPTPIDTVVVDYVGTLIDGTEFDNSIKRGEPASFPLGGVIRGWTEILQLMTKGSHWKVYIPSELGYGERGAGGAIPPNAALIFEITLRDIKPAVTK